MITNNELQKKFYDKDFRKKLIANPEKHLTELGYELYSGVKVKVVKSSKNVFYLSVDSRDDIDISKIQAAISKLDIAISSVATIGSLATISSAGGSLGTIGSLGSLGSLGSIGV